jgi:hypothetical protein
MSDLKKNQNSDFKKRLFDFLFLTLVDVLIRVMIWVKCVEDAVRILLANKEVKCVEDGMSREGKVISNAALPPTSLCTTTTRNG